MDIEIIKHFKLEKYAGYKHPSSDDLLKIRKSILSRLVKDTDVPDDVALAILSEISDMMSPVSIFEVTKMLGSSLSSACSVLHKSLGTDFCIKTQGEHRFVEFEPDKVFEQPVFIFYKNPSVQNDVIVQTGHFPNYSIASIPVKLAYVLQGFKIDCSGMLEDLDLISLDLDDLFETLQDDAIVIAQYDFRNMIDDIIPSEFEELDAFTRAPYRSSALGQRLTTKRNVYVLKAPCLTSPNSFMNYFNQAQDMAKGLPSDLVSPPNFTVLSTKEGASFNFTINSPIFDETFAFSASSSDDAKFTAFSMFLNYINARFFSDLDVFKTVYSYLANRCMGIMPSISYSSDGPDHSPVFSGRTTLFGRTFKTFGKTKNEARRKLFHVLYYQFVLTASYRYSSEHSY